MQEVSTQCRRGTDTLETFIGEKNNKKKKVLKCIVGILMVLADLAVPNKSQPSGALCLNWQEFRKGPR